MFTYKLLKATDFKKFTFILTLFILPFAIFVDITVSPFEIVLGTALLFEYVNKEKINKNNRGQ